MKVVRTKEEQIKAVEEMNADLNCVYLWGRPRNIKFEPSKYFSLCVSLISVILIVIPFVYGFSSN